MRVAAVDCGTNSVRLLVADGVAFREGLSQLPVMKHRRGLLHNADMKTLIAWAEAHPEVDQPGRLVRGGFRDGVVWLDVG